MAKRKIILLGACGILLCVYITQLALALRSPITEKNLNAEIDRIVIEKSSGEIELTKSGDNWLVGSRRFPANASSASSIVNAVKNLRVLDTVGRTGNEATDARYEIDAENAIVVTAYEAGEERRVLTVGKTSTAGSQSYATLDGGADIYLVSGRLRDTFDRTVEDLRDKTVYRLESDALTAITETIGGATLAIEKSGEPAAWNAAAGTAQVDGEKAQSWASSLALVNATAWLDDDFALPDEAYSTTVVEAGNVAVTFTLYVTGEGDDAKYYGTCSETPYKFELSSYTAQKFMRTAADLAREE